MCAELLEVESQSRENCKGLHKRVQIMTPTKLLLTILRERSVTGSG
jgi:hypothetical protein